MTSTLTPQQQEILACAARLVAEDGFEYGSAKQQAIRQLGLPQRTPLPDNAALEDAIQGYIELFCAHTQPQELYTLREIALHWMQVMQDFSPHLSGAVWHGTATRHSDIHLQLFCDDPKSPEIHLINQNIRYISADTVGLNNNTVNTLCVSKIVSQWQQQILIHLAIYDINHIRGALKPDAKGRPPRGDIAAVRKLLHPT